MSLSSIHFKAAAAGFFTLLYLVNRRKHKVRLKSTITFQVLLFLMMLSSYLMVMLDIALGYGASDRFLETVLSVDLCVDLMAFGSIHCYILSLAYKLRYSSPSVIAGGIATVLSMALLLTNPWSDVCFVYNDSGIFYQTPVFWGIVGVVICFLVYDMIILWVFCTEYKIRRKLLCTEFLIAFALFMVAEMIRPLWSAGMMLLVLALSYIYYLSQQSPDFYIDSVTGSFNRNGFLAMFRERLFYHRETACFLVRVRNFDSMKKIYGEERLWEVQRRIRGILLQEVPEGTAFHIGASTYAVILDSKEEAVSLYEAVKEKIPEDWMIKEEEVSHEYSFYLSVYPEDGEDIEELIQRLHYARSDHENHHLPGELIRLRHDTVEQAEDKKKVAHLIEEAIMDNSIEIQFQPIYSIEKGRITSLEVLSRLKDDKKQYINPEYFIHVAEENHTIIHLGEQIFAKACAFASRNHIFQYGIEDININLSPGQCRYERLTERLTAIAESYDIPMERMHLEITESEFTDFDAVEKTLQSLKDTGAKVAMDDFGTGSSTLVNILELPVDFVKIDKSLVWSYARGENQFLMDLMPMIKAEGKKIIAEGIETQEHIDIIKGLQGDFLQGYFFSKPLKEKQFMRFVKEYNQVW